jgi:hypothetical protein
MLSIVSLLLFTNFIPFSARSAFSAVKDGG